MNDIRSAVTAVGLIAFLALVVWAWSARRRQDFDEAAQLPFKGEPPKQETRNE